MSRYAVIDIGTNSVKLVAARVMHGRITRLTEESAVTRLGEGLGETGELGDLGMDVTLEAVRRFKTRAQSFEVDKLVVVGTEAFRRATNAAEYVEDLKRILKIKVEILPGEEEARLSALAVLKSLDLPGGKVAVADVGGGSTEVIRLENGVIIASKSLPVGVRTLTDAYARRAPLNEDAGEALAVAVAAALSEVAEPADMLVGVGGTASTLAAMQLELETFDIDRIHGFELLRSDVDDIYEELAESTIAERRRMKGLPNDRADVIPAGAALSLGLMVACGVDRLTVCACGLRHGVFHDRFVGP